MIKTAEQAIAVQTRRREAGLKGRSKAVRRWFRREYKISAIEIYIPQTDADYGLKKALEGNFDGCRSYAEMKDQEHQAKSIRWRF